MEYKIGEVEGMSPIEMINMYIANISTIDFDIALLDCLGLGNILAHAIYNHLNKSAINVGSNLPLIFGLYYSKYKNEFPDVTKMFIDKKWKCLDKI